MQLPRLVSGRRCPSTLLIVLTFLIIVSSSVETAFAIPVFARKYQTACATCHAGFPKLNPLGLSFKMNGYRFPRDDDEKVKQPPLQLGNDSYKDIFPNSVLPSSIPMMPPVAFEYQQVMTTNMWNHNGVPAPGPSPDFNFPTQFNILTAGTVTKQISYWGNLAAAPNGTGPGTGLEVAVERMFFLVNNILAPDEQEDENGFHEASGLGYLPRHALNLKVGQFDPYCIAPYAMNYRSVTITNRLPNTVTIGSNPFAFEPSVRGVEAYGTVRNFTTWAVGIADGSANKGASGNNSQKDIYARLGHKWWGFPLDGQVVMPKKPTSRLESEETRGQSPEVDQEEDDPTPWLDYYRATQFETGIFVFEGRNGISPLANATVFQPTPATPPLQSDNFSRFGLDFQWQHQDLHLLGMYMYGQDSNAGTMGSNLNFNSWFVEANYYYKPWIIGYARYEELRFVEDWAMGNNIQRAVPGVAFYPILNFAVRTEFVIDASGKGTTPNQLLMMADYAF